MNVYLEDGQRLYLDSANVIGSGGEGSVFRLPDQPSLVIKIYENPTEFQGLKLGAFLKKKFVLTNAVAAPQNLVFDSRKKVLGFSMPFFKGVKAIRELAVKKYRNAMSIGNADVVEILTDTALSLTSIHSQRIVVGDLNDLNVMFSGKKSWFIDVDSWQFDQWPCPVATENYLDPSLYNKDLSSKALFVPENDWYAFAVMLFRSLLLVHPYGGTHQTLRTLPERAINKVTVFDKGVIYPAIAYPPDVISDDMGNVFANYFKNGWREAFPVSELLNFASVLIKCPACQSDYPKNRRSCPICKEQNLGLTSVVLPGSISMRTLLSTSGSILYSRMEEDSLVVITKEGDFVFWNLVNLNGTKRAAMFPYEKGMRFEASKEIVVVNISGTKELAVYEVQDGKVLKVGETITDIYSVTQNAVIRVSGKFLYRMIGSNLIQTEFRNRYELNSSLRGIIDNQSWFTASSESNPTFVGFYRVLRQQFFWMYQSGMSVDLPVPQLESGEGLVDLSIKFSTDYVLVIRKTKHKGEDYVRFDLINKTGKSLVSERLSIKNIPSDRIHGLAFSRGKLIYPTDSGAVKFDLENRQLASFPTTIRLINSSHSIFAYASGMLIVDEKRVSYITMN